MTRRGACTCAGVEADGRGCRCVWGELLRKLHDFAYAWDAKARAEEAPALGAELAAAVIRGRSLAVFELAEAGDSHESLATELGVSRQRIGQLVKEAREKA